MQLEEILISMKVFETDIFPFVFCVAELNERKEITDTFLDADGYEITYPDCISGLVVRAKYKDTGSICSLIVINRKNSNIGTIAHEANHSAENLLENIGVYHNSNTSEVYSYAIGFITQKIYETLWE